MSADKMTLHIEEAGSGTPVLLIHGFPFSSRMWRPQLSSLASQAHLLAPDLPGFGDSPAAPDANSVERLAQLCAECLDAKGIREPAVIGGLSMGGYIALAFVRLFPERVRALMLLSTRPGADSDEAKANRDKSIAAVREQGAQVPGEGMYPKLLAPGNYADKPEVAAELRAIMQGATREGVIAALSAMRDRPDSTGLLAQIKQPTLIVHGDEDAVINKSEAEAMAKAIAGSELHIVKKAGHLPNMEQPAEFDRAVGDFLKKLA
jgi:pimeloyl-ACP methyl ester carboxylesterase